MANQRAQVVALSVISAMLVALSLAPARPAQAAALTVTRTDDPTPGPCLPNDCSLREAVAAANADPDSTIILPAGTYNLSISGSPLTLTKSVTISGAGADVTTIDAHGLYGVLTFSGPAINVVVSGLTIRGGNDPIHGGGIEAASTPSLQSFTLTDSWITANKAAGQGGGAYVQADTVNIARVTFSGNTADQAAGLLIENYTAGALSTLTNVTIHGNTATSIFGGLEVIGKPANLNHVTISGNANGNAGTPGSGLAAVSGSVVTLRATILSGNTGSPNCGTSTGGSIVSAMFNFDGGSSCGFTAGFPTNDRNLVNPLLGPLQINGGKMPTRALLTGSPAIDTVLTGTCPSTDQRNVSRPINGGSQGNVCDSGAFEFQPSANLGLVLSDTPDPVGTGANLTYTAQVGNNGPDPAVGTVLTDTLPSGVTFVSVTTNVGGCAQASGTVTCDIGKLPSGGFAAVIITVTADVAGTLSNSASVTSSSTDANLANNTSSVSTTVTSGGGGGGGGGGEPPTQTPTPTLTPTLPPTPTPSACAPRPSVGVVAAPVSGGRLQVTVTSNTAPAMPGNHLTQLRVTVPANARIDVLGGTTDLTGSASLPVGDGTQPVVFFVRRVGSGAITVPLVIVDTCGEWPTFVGGGASAF